MKWSASVCGVKSHGRAYSIGGKTLITNSSYPSGGREHGDVRQAWHRVWR